MMAAKSQHGDPESSTLKTEARGDMASCHRLPIAKALSMAPKATASFSSEFFVFDSQRGMW